MTDQQSARIYRIPIREKTTLQNVSPLPGFDETFTLEKIWGYRRLFPCLWRLSLRQKRLQKRNTGARKLRPQPACSRQSNPIVGDSQTWRKSWERYCEISWKPIYIFCTLVVHFSIGYIITSDATYNLRFLNPLSKRVSITPRIWTCCMVRIYLVDGNGLAMAEYHHLI